MPVRAGLTDLKKHTGALQELAFPELAGLALSALRQRRLLQRAPTPAQIAALPAAELHALAGEHQAAVLAAARTSFAPAALTEASAPALQAMLGIIAQLETALAKRHLKNGTLVLYDLSSSYREGTPNAR